MNKIKAIIVDDEQWARTVLNSLLEKDFNHIEVVAKCEDVLSAVEQIKLHQPDVIFLDVQMPEYAGFELVNFIDEINFEIIFVTAFDRYAIKAFELNAVDYLVKPIDRKKLSSSIDKLTSKLEQKGGLDNYHELLRSIKDKSYNKIVLPELGNRRILELDSIIAIEADDTYCRVYLTNEKVITVSKTLKYFEELLEENTCFFRSHRSWIINLKYIETYNKSENTITMARNIKTMISRKKNDEFELAIKEY
ncbi:MAG: response regulator [Crocinitomicaceae bacterium]|nr:response regulator [Flavobacteriales bacterium]NQZ38206.1 response regulator [Crocinitomicaceae bacterium]